MSHPIRDAADQAKSAAAAYKPESLQKWGRDLSHLPDAIGAFADSIDFIRRHGDENLPAHKSLIEHLTSTVKLIREAGKAAEALPSGYRSMHETDEDRLETPRGGSRVIEARADVTRAQEEI